MNQLYNFLWGTFMPSKKISEEDLSASTYKWRSSKASYFSALTAVLMLFCVTDIFAQANEYTFSQSTGTYTEITGGTQLVGCTDCGTAYDANTYGITLPSSFPFRGTTVSAVTMVVDGSLVLGTATGNNATGPLASGQTATGIIAALGMDLRNTTIAGQQYELRWEEFSAEYVFQWKNASRWNQNTVERFDFQIRINKTTGVINIVYGTITTIASSTTYQPVVGLRGSTNSDFIARRLTTTVPDAVPSWDDTAPATSNSHNLRFTSGSPAAFPFSGLTYTFTPPSCYSPSELTATLPTANGITLGWTASSSAPASGYEYYISDVNTAPVAATAPTGTQPTGTSVAAGSLNPSTTYYAWVRSACSGSDKSSWTGPVTFLTTQIPASLPYTDGFEGANDWTLRNGSQANKWFVDTFVNNGGTKSMYVSSNATGASNDYTNTTSTVHAYRDLAIPAGLSTAELIFDLRAGGESTYDYVRVWIVPTSYTPVAGTQTTTTLGGAGTVMITDYQNLTTGFVNRSFYVPVSAFAGGSARLIFEWKNDGSGGIQTAGAIDNVIFREPTCPPPSAITATVRHSGVTFAWTAPATAPADGYDIYWSTTNAAPAPATAASLNVPTGTSTTVTTLTADTVYYYWMRSVCGTSDKSLWVYGGSFIPDCAAVTPVVAQDFASYTGNMPTSTFACWREASGALGTSVAGNALAMASSWTDSNYNNAAGPNGKAALLNLYSTDDEWIISPAIDLGTTVDYQLEYTASIIPWSGAGPVTDMGEKYGKVLISTDGGVTWTAANTLKTYDNANIPAGGVDEIISLASYTGVVKIAFYGHSTTTTTDLRFYIDNFRVRAVPSCIAPTDVTVSSVTKSGATVSWTASATAPSNGYQYYVGETNTAPATTDTPTGSVGAGVVSANLSGLDFLTDYFVWVRANCGSDGQSEWVGPVAFTTLCDYKEITTTTPATRCGTGTVTLAATATGGTLTWSAGAGPLGTGPSFTTPQIDETTTFYVSTVESAAGTGVIGTATTLTGNTEQPTAFNNRFSSYKSQIIYTAQELLASGLTTGNITSIAFNVATLGSGADNSNFTVKMANTALSSFTTTAYQTGGFSTVFGPATYTHTATGWQTITFTTPYFWDGESNIVIEVSHNGANSSDNAQTYYTETTDTMLLSTINNLTATSGTTSAKRLNITFGGQVGCSSPKTAVVATVTAPPAFALSSGTVTICSGQPSSAVTVQTGTADYDDYVWSPSTGVTGNETDGWVFSPTANTTYTVTATNTVSGCATTATVAVTANMLPTPLSITPSPASVCADTAQALTVTGGLVPMTATLGTGTAAPGSTTMPQPFTAWYGGAKTQMLFKESELLALGFVPGSAINSVAFDFEVSVASALNDFRIKIGPTTNANMSGGFVSSSALTTVYNQSWTPTAGVTGFVPFVLTTSYIWDGGDIIIEVAHNQGNTGNGSGTRTRITPTTYPSVYYGLRDNVTPAGMASFDALTSHTNSGDSANRPNIRFNFNGPSDDVTWTPVTNLYTDAAATTAYVAGSGARTVYIKAPLGTAATTYTATVTNDFGCTASATTDVSVVDCGIGWANVQYPANGTINTCGNHAVYAQVYKAGVTEAAGQGADITAWIGVSTSNTDPATWAETDWHTATFNVQAGNNDEYTYTISGLPAGTYYYASRFRFMSGPYAYGGFSGGEWDGTNNVSGILTVNAVNAPTATATQTFCNSGTVANLVATGEAGATISWYAASTGGTALDGTTALTDGGVYYASQTVNGCESTGRTMVTASIHTPAAPTATETQSFCNAATVADLNATGVAGATISWYSASTDSTVLASTTPLVNGSSYYASQTVSGCESLSRVMVTVSVGVIAAPTANASQTFCNSGTVGNLQATGTAGSTIAWYSAATGGTALANTTALTNGGVYYASQIVGSCESTTRTMVTVTINAPAAPTANASQTFCNSGTVANLQATGTAGATISWYSASTGGTALASTTALTNGGVYYASQTVDGCESTGRTMVTATINTPVAPAATAQQTFCNSGTVADLQATGTAGATISWYSASTGGTALASTTALTDGGTYYASQTVNGCESTGRTMVTATINTPAAPTATAQQTFCNSGTVADLQATGTAGATILWYSASTGGTALASTTALTDGGTYYASQTVNGCESTGRAEVTAEITVVDAPGGDTTQEITVENAADATIEDIVVTATGTVIWYPTEDDALNGTNALAANTQLVDGNTYYGTQTIGTCESATFIAVTMDVVLGKEGFDHGMFRYHPNPVKDVLNISYTSEISSVTVFDLLGQQVISKQPNATEVKIDLSALADATYIVNVTAGNTVKTIKVVKKQ